MTNIIDMKSFKEKKDRKNNKLSEIPLDKDLIDRIARIKKSITRINELMGELKSIDNKRGDKSE